MKKLQKVKNVKIEKQKTTKLTFLLKTLCKKRFLKKKLFQ